MRGQEHRFVANRLLKDATDHVAKLEGLLIAATELAAPLTADDAGFLAGAYLTQAVDLLKAHIKAKGMTAEALLATRARLRVGSAILAPPPFR